MKRLLIVIVCACVLAILVPAPAIAAHHWWPHRSKSNSAAPQKDTTKKSKFHRDKRSNSGTEPLYSIPKTVGWWRPGPGPAGAGS